MHLKTLQIDRLTFRYVGVEELALRQVSLTWRQGEFLILAGPSGSGKSTLGRLIKGLIEPENGEISLEESGRIQRLEASARLDLIGWIDARPERQIFASTVEEEVGFALANQGIGGRGLRNEVLRSLEQVSLNPNEFFKRDPMTLSGGEKRRLAIASTIIRPTPFLILDEPEAGLDSRGLDALFEVLKTLKNSGAGVMVVSHEPMTYSQMGDRLLAIERGTLKGEYRTTDLNWNHLNNWLESGTGEPQ